MYSINHVTCTYYVYVVSTRLNGIQVMVDMHFIMTLLDFVKTSTRPLTSPPEVPMGADTPDFQEDTSATSRDQTPEPRVPASRHSSSSLKEERPSSQSKMVITAQVKQPLIALLEHTTNANPRALVLQVRDRDIITCCIVSQVFILHQK